MYARFSGVTVADESGRLENKRPPLPLPKPSISASESRPNQLCRGHGQGVDPDLLGEQRRYMRVLQHESQSFAWIAWIQGHISPSRFENGIKSNHHFQRARNADAHPHLRANAHLAQMPRQLVRMLVELPIKSNADLRKSRPQHPECVALAPQKVCGCTGR